MTEYVYGLWIGGGITRAALKEVIGAIEYHLELKNEHKQGAWHLPPSVVAELENLANAARADLTRMPEEKPECDLI